MQKALAEAETGEAGLPRRDQQSGEPALQRLQVIERRRIDKNLAATAAGDVSRGEIRPALARPRAQR